MKRYCIFAFYIGQNWGLLKSFDDEMEAREAYDMAKEIRGDNSVLLVDVLESRLGPDLER